MAKVFVSYSRKDIVFAKRLTAELQKCELDFWIDWEGIPPTVDWWKEIEKGIEEADVFLFLISPDSAKSKICGKEIDTAVKNGKRIIPIVVREIQWEDTPPQLGHLNYIFFSRDDDFETATKKLINAIQTDYEWAATHRRLQVKALEWERENKENSFLLRGKDLQDAEQDLATNTSKDPHPTDLQREYVFESRKATDRQRRLVSSISIAGFIVMALLTIVAFVQLNNSRAQQIGFQAQAAFAEENYNTALLYAYQSNLIKKNEAADFVLSQIPYQKFAIPKAFRGHNAHVTSVSWSLNGQLASASRDKTIIIWDIKTYSPLQRLQGHNDNVSSIAWSSDGKLASASWDKTIIIWDLKTGQPAKILEGHKDLVSTVAWSSNGQLASASYDRTIILWDLETGQPAKILEGHKEGVTSVAWSSNGQLASASHDRTIILWDLESGRPAQILEGHKEGVTSVAWSPDGQLASASSDNTVIIWDLENGKPSVSLGGTSFPTDIMTWSPNGQLATKSGYNTIKIAEKDILNGNLCSSILRNLTTEEWVNTQGILFIYRPACHNLYDPSIDGLGHSIFQEVASGFQSLGLPETIAMAVAYIYLAVASPFMMWSNPTAFEVNPIKLFLITWKGRAILLFSYVLFLSLILLILRAFYKGTVWFWRKTKIQKRFLFHKKRLEM